VIRPSAAEDPNFETVRVWDPLIRLFHWALALCVIVAWILGKYGPDVMTLHFYFGYAVLGLLAFRLLWGLVGPANVRFASFVYGPVTVLGYLRQMFRRQPTYRLGHNPIGGFFALVLLTVLLVHAVAGLFVDPEDYINVGPLAHLVSDSLNRKALYWHNTLSWYVLGLAALHVAAIAFYALWKREDLVRPMITGRKQVPKKGAAPHN